jgi:ERCC4-related helicase
VYLEPLSPAHIVAKVLSFQASRLASNLTAKRRILIFVSSTSQADEVVKLFNRKKENNPRLGQGLAAVAAAATEFGGGGGVTGGQIAATCLGEGEADVTSVFLAAEGGAPRVEARVEHFALSAHYKQGARAQDHLHKFGSRPPAGMAYVLVSVMMLNEGYDCPGVDMVVLARPTDSEIVFTQQMGRGLRRDASDPHKEITVLDLALNLRRRWKRMLRELPDAAVHEAVASFWPVTNFVGLDSLS